MDDAAGQSESDIDHLQDTPVQKPNDLILAERMHHGQLILDRGTSNAILEGQISSPTDKLRSSS